MLTSILDSSFKDIVAGCKSAVCNFGIKDFIEIIILSGILFLAFHLLKGKKAGALATGLIVLAGLSALSNLLNFTVPGGILSNENKTINSAKVSTEQKQINVVIGCAIVNLHLAPPSLLFAYAKK